MSNITPPPELVEQWISELDRPDDPRWQEYEQDIADRAAHWGADQELESCCSWVDWKCSGSTARLLREDRRPKPPSLKEQALELARPAGTDGAYVTFGPEELALIRRALEQLDD